MRSANFSLQLGSARLMQAALTAITGVLVLAPASAAEPPAGTSRAVANLTACALPQWPKESLRKGESGAVTLKFLIGDDGKVLDTVVRKSSGFPALDEAARAGLQKCTFTPGRYEGKPIAQWMPIQYVWKLSGGTELQRDITKAESYRTDAKAGDLEALVKLALMFTGGSASNLPTDKDYAIKLLRLGAERGHAQAEYELANALRYGSSDKTAIAVGMNEAEAVKWVRSAAAHGYAPAQFDLGRMYLSGRGVERSLADGVAMYRLAADQGNAEAQLALGRMLDRGHGVQENAAEAAARYRKAAEANIVEAQFLLGQAYLNGRGVAQDPAEAAIWLSKAAADREPGAEALLASLYLKGNGVAQDTAQAVSLLRRAAQSGNIDAMADLGKLLTAGQPASADSAEGEMWLRKASGWSKYAGLRAGIPAPAQP